MPDLSYYCSPVRPGFPISQWGGSVTAFGTLGCFVVDREDSRNVYMLGNYHVLQYFQDDSYFFPDTKGQNTITCPHIGEIVTQASERISGFGEALELLSQKKKGGKQLLDFYRERQPLYSKGSAMQCADYSSVAQYSRGILSEVGDAAVARLFKGVSWANITPSDDVIRPPLSDTLAQPGARVWKWGYMSDKKKYGKIKGLVKSETTFTAIQDSMFPEPSKKPRFIKTKVSFPEVYEVKGESKDEVFQPQGDSGSILCRADTNEVVGLMSFRGSDRTAYAFPIHPILEALGVEIPVYPYGTTYGGPRTKVKFRPVL